MDAFLRSHPEAGGVQVMPVTLPLLILLHCAWWALCRLAIHITYYFDSDLTPGKCFSFSFLLFLSGVPMGALLIARALKWR